MFKKKKEPVRSFDLVIKKGTDSHDMCLGGPEGVRYVGSLIEHGAQKVEITLAPDHEDIIEQMMEGYKDLREAGANVPGWEVIFEQIADTYSHLRAFDAIGLAGIMVKDAIKGLPDNRRELLQKTSEIAALLKLEEVAALNLDWESLLPEERRMLSGQFITSLGDVKHLLAGGNKNQGKEGENRND